ncbi:hypothetical protein GCM10009766_16130 [Microcella frigidaquae]
MHDRELHIDRRARMRQHPLTQLAEQPLSLSPVIHARAHASRPVPARRNVASTIRACVCAADVVVSDARDTART